MLYRVILALVTLLVIPGSGAAQIMADSAALPPTNETYELRAGDRVTIELYTSAGVEVAVVGGERTVDNDGNVFLPFVGTVRVAGMKANDLRAELTGRYAEFYADPVVDIKVELRISVTGAVRDQGQFYVDPTTTVVHALAIAGGMSAEVAVNSLVLPADQTRIRLVQDGVTYILNLRPDEVTSETLALRVRSGDWIHVPPRSRSEVRDQITFWGGVLSFVTGIVSLIILANR